MCACQQPPAKQGHGQLHGRRARPQGRVRLRPLLLRAAWRHPRLPSPPVLPTAPAGAAACGRRRRPGRTGVNRMRRRRLAVGSHVQLPPDLAVAPQLDVDPLVQAEPDQVERLLDGASVGHLLPPLCARAAGGKGGCLTLARCRLSALGTVLSSALATWLQPETIAGGRGGGTPRAWARAPAARSMAGLRELVCVHILAGASRRQLQSWSG